MKTFDLGLTAALVASGFKLKQIDKSNPKKAEFIFNETQAIRDTSDRYWSGELKVPALALFESMKNLKNRLYSSAD